MSTKLASGIPSLQITPKPIPTDSSTPSKWLWKPFVVPSRTDGLVLSHWEKSTGDDSEKPPDFTFRDFGIVQYTDEEYRTHLEDPDWTKEETDYLFGLCKTYDLRWFVIHDRYEFPGKMRTMEELKDRIFVINNKLGSLKLIPQNYKFDKNKEVERKKNLRTLLGRSREQMMEEAYLVYELRQRQQNETRTARERDLLVSDLRFIDSTSIGSQKPTGSGEAAATTTDHSESLRKKKKSLQKIVTATPGTPAAESPSHEGRHLKKSHTKSAESAEALDSPLKSAKPQAMIYARSQKLTPLKTALIPKVHHMLEELGVAIRPRMPTAQVMAKYEELRSNIQILIELKRQHEKAEHELKMLTAKKHGHEHDGAGKRPSLHPGGSMLKRSLGTPGMTPNKRQR
ncbi:uncharacterized protein BJ171DRAFT_512327 [Polychytrium aggregatum]|uniref:uncharacterized protein n=1 Tax=Polychytrium aggregatum TaxID=110093 RepID=UPI0022FE1E3C|nr:uncharacterized protein BJ171DRAFT_512327 [Polychytrium aggregatum]KAI9202857.1 hypothetical protein BJ171DRAFT_512327 [Polychytrium aggregatum]